MILALLSALLAAAGPGPGLDQAIRTADSLVAASLGRQYTGAVLLVARNGTVLREQAYGTAKPGTMFDLASVTKVTATTFAMMLLVDRHQVELDAPVYRYLPEFRGPHLDSITVRHLLTHSSGLEQWQPLYYHAKNGRETYDVIRSMPLKWGVGEGRHYSDLGFMLLGYLVERVTGRPLDNYLARELYQPLGLKHTAFNPKRHGFKEFIGTEDGNVYEKHMVYDPNFGYDYNGDPRAWDGWRTYVLTGEVDDGNAWYANGGTAGHAGLFSTAADLRVLLQVLLDGGTAKGKRYLAPQTIQAFLSKDRFLHYLGWQYPPGLPDGTFAHNGFTGTYVFAVPKYGLSFILLTNRQRIGPDARGYFPDLGPLQQSIAKALVAGAAADAEAAP